MIRWAGFQKFPIWVSLLDSGTAPASNPGGSFVWGAGDYLVWGAGDNLYWGA